MAHFAELDNNNIVQRVIVVHNNELLKNDGNEYEQKGVDFCVNHYGGRWIQTSYNATIRGNFAGVGFFYDEKFDIFFAEKCHDKAILNTTTAQWDCEDAQHDRPKVS